MIEYKLIKNVAIYKQANEAIGIISDQVLVPIIFYNTSSSIIGWQSFGNLRNPRIQINGSLISDILIFNKAISLEGLIPICEFHPNYPNLLINVSLYNPNNTVKKNELQVDKLRTIESYKFEIIS
jgi:hypothetical protein